MLYPRLSSRLIRSKLMEPLRLYEDMIKLDRRWYHATTDTQATAYCDFDAEPLQRYKPGGYHPVNLGDNLKSSRYQILHKLGWGGYAAIWLAQDHKLNRAVAVKILVSELGREHQEASIHYRLSRGPVIHAGRRNTPEIFDSFELHGPNGTHQCLVLEPLGAATTTLGEAYAANRLPGKLAWKVAKQVAQAISYLHCMGVVHGDLHPGNIVLANENISRQTSADILYSMDAPIVAEVRAVPGTPLTRHLPLHLVLPSTLPIQRNISDDFTVKVIDFGSAFLSGDSSPKMRCPLPFRVPEAVITGHWDTKADIWCLGCTIFALLVGYPPFDSFMFKEEELIGQWVATFGALPKEWERSPILRNIEPASLETADFSEWLHETYYDDGKVPFFSNTELKAIADLLLSLLRYLPSERPSADQILREPLFSK